MDEYVIRGDEYVIRGYGAIFSLVGQLLKVCIYISFSFILNRVVVVILGLFLIFFINILVL